MAFNDEIHIDNVMLCQCNTDYYLILHYHDREFVIDHTLKTLELIVGGHRSSCQDIQDGHSEIKQIVCIPKEQDEVVHSGGRRRFGSYRIRE